MRNDSSFLSNFPTIVGKCHTFDILLNCLRNVCVECICGIYTLNDIPPSFNPSVATAVSICASTCLLSSVVSQVYAGYALLVAAASTSTAAAAGANHGQGCSVERNKTKSTAVAAAIRSESDICFWCAVIVFVLSRRCWYRCWWFICFARTTKRFCSSIWGHADGEWEVRQVGDLWAAWRRMNRHAFLNRLVTKKNTHIHCSGPTRTARR